MDFYVSEYVSIHRCQRWMFTNSENVKVHVRSSNESFNKTTSFDIIGSSSHLILGQQIFPSEILHWNPIGQSLSLLQKPWERESSRQNGVSPKKKTKKRKITTLKIWINLGYHVYPK